MGKKGGKKKEPGQGSGAGPPEQSQAEQSSSVPQRAESQASVSSQPPTGQSTQRGGGQGRGGFGRGSGAPRQEGQLRGQQQQIQQGGGQQGRGQQGGWQQSRGQQGGGHQQGQWGERGRGGDMRGQGRGAGQGRGGGQSLQQQHQAPAWRGQGSAPQPQKSAWGQSVSQPDQPSQQAPVPGVQGPVSKPFTSAGQGHQQHQAPAWGGQGSAPQPQKLAWGQSASQPAQPTAASSQQVPQGQDSVPKKEPTADQVTQQMSAVSLEDQKKAAAKLSPTKEIAKIRPIEQLGIPKRKNPFKAGTSGKPIKVFTNMMEIKFGPKFKSTVVHYDVSIDPDKPKYLMRHAFNAARAKLFANRYPAFDGKKNAFSAGRLPIENPTTTEVTVYNEDGKEKQYKVTFKVANELDLSWLKNVKPGLLETERNQISLQALDIILRSAPAMQKHVTTVGRSFFTPPTGRVMSLGGGMDVWVGLFQSAVLGWKPLLNVDVAHKGFPSPQTVLDLMKTVCGCDGQGGGGGRGPPRGGQQYGRGGYDQGPTDLTVDLIRRNNDEISKFLRGLKVVYEIPGQATSRRTQRVNGLVKCPRENSFDHNGQIMTIEQYYRLEKRYNIKHPDFPCLWVGSRDKNIHVPAELCSIVPGQATQKKLDEKQTANMIRFAATGTQEREKKIMDAFNHMNHNNDPCMKEFGISVSGEFEKVSARVLDPPALAYEEGRLARVNKGVWRADRFLKPSPTISEPNSWTILNLNRFTKDNELFYLYEQLQKTGQGLGMKIGKPATPFEHIEQKGNDIRQLRDFFDRQKKKNLKLIVCIVPEMKGPYSKVKQISELSIGILTQCLKGKTLQKLSPATTSNILLKINAKLNGINHKIAPARSLPDCLTRPCMIVGADVTHPSPDAKDIPSIAAVAASHDPCAFKYNIEIRLQPPRMEIIQELAEIMRMQLIYFYKQTGQKPLKIVFYRDGVSEGQFSQVMDAELVAIRKACSSLPGDYRPPISFMVVQKRHHTRFFPADSRETDDRNCNVRAGTIVDTEITHPSDIDFYLVSHASIQGTARPTKYRCLHDDANMSEDEIEQLTYFLCHMFSRCTRSVSYPTPTYYAHLAAFRARALTDNVDINIDNLAQEQRNKLTLKEDVSKLSPMFFV